VSLGIAYSLIRGNRFFSVIKIRDIQAVTNDRGSVHAVGITINVSRIGLVQDVDDPGLLLLVSRMLASAATAALAILARVNLLHVFDADHFSVPLLIDPESVQTKKKATVFIPLPF
jgi:hypothetical protein